MQYRDPDNRRLVIEGLTLAGRTDLIGNGGQFFCPATERETNKYTLKYSRKK
jgi:hypothetical protein